MIAQQAMRFKPIWKTLDQPLYDISAAGAPVHVISKEYEYFSFCVRAFSVTHDLAQQIIEKMILPVNVADRIDQCFFWSAGDTSSHGGSFTLRYFSMILPVNGPEIVVGYY